MTTPPTPCPHAATLPGQRTVCDACKRKRHAKYQRQRRAARTRAKPRFCRYCGKVRMRKRQRTCAECRRRMQREQRLRWLADPVNREKQRQARRAWAARHPGAGWAWVKARRARHPSVRERELEVGRMSSRLLREKQGKVNRPVPAERYPRGNPKDTIPAAPLLALVDARLGDGEVSEAELCALIGIPTRTLYRLRYEQSNVSVAVADRIATTLGSQLELVTP